MPSATCRSEWQTPLHTVRTSSSSDRSSARSTSSIVRGCCAFWKIAAFIRGLLPPRAPATLAQRLGPNEGARDARARATTPGAAEGRQAQEHLGDGFGLADHEIVTRVDLEDAPLRHGLELGAARPQVGAADDVGLGDPAHRGLVGEHELLLEALPRMRRELGLHPGELFRVRDA